ncbi:MAG: hypothetical protein LBS19_05580, partial [Clostridiales bacterium]|nr:hypothetical protein [Clostridiales bacterium]
WDAASWSLSITPGSGAAFNPLPVEQNLMPVGSVKCPYVYTTVKTYLSGVETESFAIDGRTLIDFELLAKYGQIEWSNAERSLRLTVPGETAPVTPVQSVIPMPEQTQAAQAEAGIEPYDLKWVDGNNGIISFAKGISDDEAAALGYLYAIRLYVNDMSAGGIYYFPPRLETPARSIYPT